MVAPSSNVLDKFWGASFLWLNSPLYILPGNTMAIYWSAVTILIPMQVATVVIIKEAVELTKDNKDETSFLSRPVVSRTDPNVKDQITSQIGFNMLIIPPLLNKSLTIALLLSNWKPEKSAIQTPENIVKNFDSSGLATNLVTASGWNITAKKPPKSAPIITVGKAGTLL